MTHPVAATVTAMILMAVTVAHAAGLNLNVGTLLAFSQPVTIEIPEPPEPPVVFPVHGFGDPAPGEPLGPPWETIGGTIVWAADGQGVGKPGGQNQVTNIAVIDVGRNDVAVSTVITELRDGPGGGEPTLVGLTLLSDGVDDHVLVTYERRTGMLTVRTPATVLGSISIGTGRDEISLRAEIELQELRVFVDGDLDTALELAVTAVIPETYNDNTRHGIYVNRDNRAVFTEFSITELPPPDDSP